MNSGSNLPTPNLKQALAILWGVTLSYSDFAACYVQQQWSFLYHLFADVALCPRSWLHELCTAIKQINRHQSPARAECLSTLTREMTDNFCISLSTVLMCGANITLQTLGVMHPYDLPQQTRPSVRRLAVSNACHQVGLPTNASNFRELLNVAFSTESLSLSNQTC